MIVTEVLLELQNGQFRGQKDTPQFSERWTLTAIEKFLADRQPEYTNLLNFILN